MLENPATDSTAAANIATVKRYAPPNQRNRSLGRRKSGADRLERAGSFASDGEKNQNNIPRNMPGIDHGDAGGGNNRMNDNRRPSGASSNLIPLNGCCNSEVLQLLNDRWATAMNLYNTLPEGLPEKPVMYTRTVSPWRLPHQMTQAAVVGPSVGLQRDFSSELWQAMNNPVSSSKQQ